MTLTQSGQEMSNETTMCDTEVIVSARETITGLATAFGP
jgi:hypothetical protein